MLTLTDVGPTYYDASAMHFPFPAETPYPQPAMLLNGSGNLFGLGQDAADEMTKRRRVYWTIWGILSTASMAVSAFHGYRRHDSIWGGLGWGFLGALFPVLTPTIAFAQGYAQPK